MSASEIALYEQIDNDKALTDKKRLLVVTSFLLLVIQFSGAKIVEANTFILKLDFSHQKGLALLLFISVVFLLIRYYGYARKYHIKIKQLWNSDLLHDTFISHYCQYSNEYSGLMHQKYPKGFCPEETLYKGGHIHYVYENTSFKRAFRYDVIDEHGNNYEYRKALFSEYGSKNFLKVLSLELKYQLTGYLKYREFFDILGPYIIGVLAIISYVFHDYLSDLIQRIVG